MTGTAIKRGVLLATTIVTLNALILVGRAQAQGTAPPNISGAYQCQPDPAPCMWSGQTPSISQSGAKLDIKNDKGETAAATLTSDITISAGGPMNAYGVIRTDHSIDW